MNAASAAAPARRPWTRVITPATDFPRLGVPDRYAGVAGRSRSAETKRIKSEMGARTHPTVGDPDYTAEDTEFLKVILEWRARSGRPFPTNCELFALVRGMGYVKVPHGYKLVEISPAEMALIPESMDAPEAPHRLRVISPNE